MVLKASRKQYNKSRNMPTGKECHSLNAVVDSGRTIIANNFKNLE